MARNTKAVPVRVTFLEAFAASIAESKAKETMMAWARSIGGNRKPKESESDYRKRAFFTAGAEIFAAGSDYHWLLDQTLLEGEEPQYKLASKPGGKPHSLCAAIYAAVKEKYPKAKSTEDTREDKGWGAGDAEIVAELTKVFKAKGITTKAAAIGFLSGLAAS